MVLYLRVSTEEQAASGLGLEAQHAHLQRAATYHGWHVVDVIRDEGISGSSMERAGLRRALELIAAGDADGLVVAKLDRLTRSSLHFAELLAWFEDAAATLVMLEPDVDFSTPLGRMFATLVAAFAEFERAMIAERTRVALAAKRGRGEATGREAVADRPELAERIRLMRASGMSLGAIADQLNAERVPTARGAAAWRSSSVQTAAGWRRRPPRRRHSALPDVDRRRRHARAA